MKFAANVKPILQANCYACHSNANYAVSGVKLEDYADVKGHADDGMLMGVITHAPGYPAMPQSGGKLSDCNINKIQAWINRGAQNN
jgi:cytochrome c5